MNPLDLLRKPLNLDPKLFQPTTPAPQVPAVKVSPITVASTPLPSTVTAKLNTVAQTPSTPFASLKPKDPISIVNKPLPEAVTQFIKGPVETPRVVRNQDFKDVVNMIPQLVGGALQPVGDVGASALKLSNDKLGTNFPTTTKIPNIFQDDIHGGKNAYESHTLQESYTQRVSKGDSPTKALLKTALEGGMDVAFAIPFAEHFVKNFADMGIEALKGAIPEKLITPEMVSASREQVRNFASGADTYNGAKSPLPVEIQEAFKEATPEGKLHMVKSSGVDIMTAKPSAVGKLFGISQEDADVLLQKLYGAGEGGVREGSSGALPGYRRESGQAPAFGLSTERVERVGGEAPKTPEEVSAELDGLYQKLADKPGDKAIKAEIQKLENPSSNLPEFKGFTDLSTNVLDKLKGRSEVSKQFISDLTNSADLKQAERDMIRNVLADYPEGSVPVQEFANKVKSELLPLERKGTGIGGYQDTKYESIALPEDLRGPVANYTEHTYQSPIKTSAGGVHFNERENPNYFAHSRIEDLPNDDPSFPTYSEGTTRRVIEIQSDLFQKGRLESEAKHNLNGALPPEDPIRQAEIAKLEPYRNTWHERVIREEVKQAAKDGKTKLQFPTGETAMKIEGLGETHTWADAKSGTVLDAKDLSAGRSVEDHVGNVWVITDVLGDGKFDAIPKDKLLDPRHNPGLNQYNPGFWNVENGLKAFKENPNGSLQETFDISGKVDTNNPIYKFYEKEVGRYLKNKYNAALITDPQGVKWWEVKVDPKLAKEPVRAYQKGKEAEVNISKAEAEKIIRSMFNEKEIKLAFSKNLKDEGYLGVFHSAGTGPFGEYTKPMIELLEENGKVSDKTLYHEAFHAHFNTYLTSGERMKALNSVRKNLLTKSYKLRPGYSGDVAKAEEWLADDFADYVRTKKSKGKFEGLWEKLLQKIRAFIRKTEGFQKVYDDILSGKKQPGDVVKGERAQLAENRPNAKLEQRAAEAKNFEEFYLHSGVTRESLDATVQKKGYADAKDFYEKNKNFKGGPREIRINQKIIEEGNAELNRVYEHQSLSNKITILKSQLDTAKLGRSLIKQALEEHPAKALIKYVSGQTGQLPEVTGKPTVKSLTGSGEEVANSDFGMHGDDIVTELGFKTPEEAQASLDEYMKIKENLKAADSQVASINKELGLHKSFEAVIKNDPALKAEYSATLKRIRIGERMRERSQGSQKSTQSSPSKDAQAQDQMGLGESLGESIPVKVSDVKPPQGRGEVTPPKLNFLQWRDKAAPALIRETLERNLESVAKTDAPEVKKFLLEPVRKNETNRTDFVNKLREEIRKEVVQKYGIRAKSEDSEFIQRYGEGDQGEFPLSLDELKYRRPKTWQNIKAAAELFRDKYSMLLEMVNKERIKFGYNPIPARPDYFRHFQAIDSAITQFGLLLREQDIPTEIAGITGIFNPNKPFSTAELKRKGKQTTIDAISGFDNYLDSITRQIYHIDSVTRGRQLEKYIRESAKVGAQTGFSEDEVRLPNFVSNLHDYTNILAGKKSAVDRALESIIGRRIYSATNYIRRKVSANLVGGNVSSALTNFIPFSQSLATTAKPAALRGIGEGLTAALKKDYDMIDGVRSDFLLRRFPDEGIDIRGFKKASEIANFMFKTIDQFTAKSVVAGKYYENVGKGMEKGEAMQKADAYAGKVLADRSLGQTPNIFNSKSLGFLTQFQTEVNNMFSFMTKDIPNFSEGSKIKYSSMLFQFLIYSYLFNEAYEKITGRRPTFDPIYAGLTLAGLTAASEDVAFSRRLLMATEDLGGNLPFTGLLTGGRIPLSGSIPNPLAVLKGDSTVTQEAKKLLTLIPPFGGGQIKKTVEGIMTVAKGEERTPSGKSVRYRTDQSALNYVRAALFGKSALPEAQEYYRGIDKKAAPRKSSSSTTSKLSGIKLIPKQTVKLNLASNKASLSGIKLIPKKKIQLTQ